MYLVDTSVWIAFLRKSPTKATDFFNEIIDQQIPFGITSIIYQEILQGASSPTDFNLLKENLSTQRFFHPKNSIISYETAASIYMKCRKKGMTIRSSMDCLIAQIALEHNLILLHDDKDYLDIKTAIPELRLYND